MPEDETKPAPSFRDLAKDIADHDGDSVKPQSKELRFQWNVPRGQGPFIPLWLALVVFGGLAVAIILAILPGP